MKEISFFFDDEEFVCRVDSPDGYEEYGELQAIAELRNIDKITFDNVKATRKFIQLQNGDTKVFIDDIDEFFKRGYGDHIPNATISIKNAIFKYQKKKQKDKLIKNLRVTASQAIAGSLVVMMLANTAHALSKNIEKDKTEEDNNPGIEVEHIVEPLKVEIQNVNISSTDISNLLAELESPREVDSLESIEKELDEEYSEEDFMNDPIFKNESIDVAYLGYEDMTGSVTFNNAYDQYNEIVEKYATKWGISSNIMMAALTQETAGNVKDNLMQIQFGSWKDQVLTAYDFVDGKNQSIVLTDTPEKYKGKGIMTISREEIKNPKTNISVACVIFRYCLDRMNFNIPVSIQAYNMGCNNMNTILEKTSKETGIPIEDLLDDPTNLDFIDYTYVINGGDENYLSNVSRYLGDEKNITVSYLDEEGNVQFKDISIVSKSL